MQGSTGRMRIMLANRAISLDFAFGLGLGVVRSATPTYVPAPLELEAEIRLAKMTAKKLLTAVIFLVSFVYGRGML